MVGLGEVVLEAGLAGYISCAPATMSRTAEPRLLAMCWDLRPEMAHGIHVGLS